MNCSSSKPFLLLILLSSLVFFSSFSKTDYELPQERKSIQQKHQERRYLRLQRRLQQARSPRQQQRLQKRIKRLEHHKNQPTALWSALGLVTSILAVVLLFIGLVVSTAAVLGSGGVALSVGIALFVIGLVFAFTGLGISIMALLLHRTYPEHYNKPGYALAGVIISSLLLGFFLLAMVASIFS